MVRRLDDGGDAQHGDADRAPQPETELHRRNVDLLGRRLGGFEKFASARVLQLVVGRGSDRAVFAETVDADQFMAIGRIDDAKDDIGRLCCKLGGEAPGEALPPHRFGRAVLRIAAAGQVGAHDAGDRRGCAESGGIFMRAARHRGERRCQHPHMHFDAFGGLRQHRRSDILIGQQTDRQRGQYDQRHHCQCHTRGKLHRCSIGRSISRSTGMPKSNTNCSV